MPTVKTKITVTAYVDYKYIPGEAPSWDSPGEPEEIYIDKISLPSERYIKDHYEKELLEACREDLEEERKEQQIGAADLEVNYVG